MLLQKNIISALAVAGLTLLAGPAAQAQTAPNVAYQSPIVITQGGTYSGNYRSLDSDVPCIKVSTTQPVIIENCTLAGAGNLIAVDGGATVIVRNNRGYGITQSKDNVVHGKFLGIIDGKSLTLEHNYMEHTTGLTIYRWTGDGSPQQTLTVRYNQSKDIDGRYRNGGSEPFPSFCGLNQVRNTANIEIAFNEVINLPNECATGDVINFYNSSGTAQSPMRLHDNYVQGAYPYPANGNVYSGTGMTTDGDATTAALITAFLDAYDNQFISTSNAAMNIAAGHDIHFFRNRLVTSGLLPDGSAMNALYAATAVFNGNGSPSSVFFNNRIDGNTIGYRNPGYTIPFPDRHDLSYGNCATCTNTTHLPNPITPQTEANELTLWQQKVQQNGIVLGPGTNGGGTPPAPAPAPAPPTVALSAPATAVANAALALTATAASPGGSIAKVEFFSGPTKLGEDLTAPYALSFVPAAGTLSLTARATDNAGAAATSAAASVVVTAATAPAPAPGGTGPGGPANATFYRAINLGGRALSIDGRAWEASAGAAGFSSNTTGFANQNVALDPATDAARAEMLRSAFFGTTPAFALANTPAGSYAVYVYIWEDNAPETTDVLVEGRVVRAGYNTGSAGHWERLGPFVTALTDGTLDISTSGGNVNVSGLEIWRVGASNAAPTVSLSAPAAAVAGTAFTVTATAADADGTIAKVEFFAGANKLGEDLTAPYTFSINPMSGTLSLKARATDNGGATATSAVSTVVVRAAPVLPPAPGGGPANATFYRALNLGGRALTIDGRAWEASAGAAGFSSNTTGFANQNVALDPATDAARAEMLRSAFFGTTPAFALANTPAGSYAVYVYVWEDNGPETTSILVEGRVVRANYNTGAAGHWERLGPFVTALTDGTLDISTSGGNVNVSGLEIWRMNSARPTAASGQPNASPLTASPNPFTDVLRLNAPVAEPETADVALYDAQGTVVRRQQLLLDPKNAPALPTSDLPAGLYTLRILSGSQRGQNLRVQK